MKNSINYVTALPDFIEMQRMSFSWFISQGLTDELSNFSSILDFSGNIESSIFGQNYKLIKPLYNASEAKKDAKSYITQLQLLIEIRDKTANIVLKRERLAIVNLPLMTSSATFIINGCERVIVSQIIRSPGIYFEKNKKQKRQKRNALIFSTTSIKLKPFLPIPWTYTKFPGILFNLKQQTKKANKILLQYFLSIENYLHQLFPNITNGYETYPLFPEIINFSQLNINSQKQTTNSISNYQSHSVLQNLINNIRMKYCEDDLLNNQTKVGKFVLTIMYNLQKKKLLLRNTPILMLLKIFKLTKKKMPNINF